MHTYKKTLQELNLLDRFLFAEAIEDKEIFEIILDIILGKKVTLKEHPQAERETRAEPWSRRIILNSYSMDLELTVYNAEVQNKNTHNLQKRSRLHNSMIDSRLLPTGIVDYNELNDVYIILIMPFELFGEGKYKYTFSMQCRESPGLELEDGATRIFLNIKGTDSTGVSQELIDLLRYFENTTPEFAKQASSSKIKRVQKKIDVIKMNEEIGVKYMNAWEEKILEKQESFSEGKTEGAMIKLITQIQRKQEKGQSTEQIADDLLESLDLVNEICSLITEHPGWDAERIYEEHKEKGEF